MLLPWKSLLEPAPPTPSPRVTAVAVPIVLGISAAVLVLAPLLMPESYSWTAYSTSYSAAQGVEGAWLARLGFLAFGLGVIWLANSHRPIWGRGARFLHICFGIFMTGAAAFSSKPWMAEATFDRFEDFLHSVCATGMGFAFAAGVLLILLRRDRHDIRGLSFDWLAIAAAVGLPLCMLLWSEMEGLFQRVMFAIAYLWYGREALRARHSFRLE